VVGGVIFFPNRVLFLSGDTALSDNSWGRHYIREAGLVGLVRAIGVRVRLSLFLGALGSTARDDNLGACEGSIPSVLGALDLN